MRIVIATVILIFTPALAYASNYTFEGLYEISVPDDWRVISSPHIAELMKQAKEIAEEVNLDVDLKDIAEPFMIYNEEDNGAFLIRTIVGPPELTKEEFDSLTKKEIKMLGEEISRRQIEIMSASGLRVISSQSGAGTFKEVSAVKTESIYYNSHGFKSSRAQYVVYRRSATLLISLEHTVLSGEPDHKIIENYVSSFNVLAQ